MFDEPFLASDSSKIRTRREPKDFLDLVSLTLEVGNPKEFRSEYFDIMESNLEEYGLGAERVYKYDHLKNHIPSFDLSDVVDNITKDLLSSEHIEKIQITRTYTPDPVITWKGEIEGLDFADDILSQYYDVVSTWKHLRNNPESPKNIILDDIQGKITECWKYVGKTSENLKICPHGDMTYPAISACDLICSFIKLHIHPPKTENIHKTLEELTSSFLNTDSVYEEDDLEKMIPTLHYSIKPINFYPHPLFLIERGKMSKDIVKGSDLFKLLLQHVYKEGGAVTFADYISHIDILEEGDHIICLDNEKAELTRKIEKLNIQRKLEVVYPEKVDEFQITIAEEI